MCLKTISFAGTHCPASNLLVITFQQVLCLSCTVLFVVGRLIMYHS